MTAPAGSYVAIARTRPLRVAVQRSDGSLMELTAPTGDTACEHVVRITAADLRDAGRKTAALHAEAAARGEDLTIVVDLEVMIDRDARKARNMLADLDRHRIASSSRYVGTATGLASLIADIDTLRLADGVTLVPMTQPVLDLILTETQPLLGAMGFDVTAPTTAMR